MEANECGRAVEDICILRRSSINMFIIKEPQNLFPTGVHCFHDAPIQ